MGVKIDFAVRLTTMPGTCIGVDTSFTKSKKLPRHLFCYSTNQVLAYLLDDVIEDEVNALTRNVIWPRLQTRKFYRDARKDRDRLGPKAPAPFAQATRARATVQIRPLPPLFG